MSASSVSETMNFIYMDILKIEYPKACVSCNSFLSYPLLILTLMGTYVGANPNPNGYLRRP